MSAQYYGARVTIPATATSLGALLVAAEPGIKNLTDSAGRNMATGVSILCRAETTNAATIYFGFDSDAALGTSTVTAAGAHGTAYIGASEAIEFHLNTWIYLKNIFVIGNGADLMYISVISQ